jgi:single-strand DNA-binding protein
VLNQCTFIGNLGADPEVKSTQSGSRVANFRLAVTEKWKTSNGEQRERTEWVSVVVWAEGLVGVVERYLRKGKKVYVQGKMQTRKWQAQDGSDRYSTEIVLQGFDAKLVMLDGPENAGNGQSRQSSGSSTRGQADDGFGDDEDSIPF